MRRTMFKPKSEYFILNQNYLKSYEDKQSKLKNKDWRKKYDIIERKEEDIKETPFVTETSPVKSPGGPMNRIPTSFSRMRSEPLTV